MVTGFSETPRFVKNSNAALIISYFLAALMALFFALGLLPGWVKMSNYAPNEPHVSRWTKPLETVGVRKLWFLDVCKKGLVIGSTVIVDQWVFSPTL